MRCSSGVGKESGQRKHFERVFPKFDRQARNYLSFVQFASVTIWLG